MIEDADRHTLWAKWRQKQRQPVEAGDSKAALCPQTANPFIKATDRLQYWYWTLSKIAGLAGLCGAVFRRLAIRRDFHGRE
ncbi:hypothetical protein, partial [Rhizobium sp. BK313]|uniref:hypothetical protein n=1 Tax=Rhizobium sp. BK313 TaxID=2587081 RepID=UPI001AAD4ADF